MTISETVPRGSRWPRQPGVAILADVKSRAGLSVVGALLLAVIGLGGCGDYGQTESCRKFVACVRAIDAAGSTRTNAARFEPDGDCWGSKAGAELCGDACSRGLEVLRRSEPARSLPECQ